MDTPRFIALSTGRSGSRYLTLQLCRAGIRTLHEHNADLSRWKGDGALGEVSAWFVTQLGKANGAMVWHFTRHPQPFVSSLMKFGFWNMNHPSIHPHLRRTGDLLVDSYRYWIDWNLRLLAVPKQQRITFRIEDLDYATIWLLGRSIGKDADPSRCELSWNERQAFAEIPDDVIEDLYPMMEHFGYAPRC